MHRPDSQQAGPVVMTERGRVQGLRNQRSSAFLGIPFAVADRFGPPSEVPDWGELRAVQTPGPAAPQLPSRLEGVMGPAALRTSEAHCLTLNIWTPDVDGSRPVLFWLHGGAWVSGSGGWPWYDGARLAEREDIVVVTANYRLGPLGYLALDDAGTQPGCGSSGFADQVAALEWVARQIARFGGDPDTITVGGQSAGGHAAALLAGAAPIRERIRRVLIQSAPLEWPIPSRSEAAQVAAEFREVLGVGAGDVDQLHEVATAELLAATGSLARRRHRFASIAPPFQPSRSELLPWATPLDALRSGRDDLDVLVGATSAEMRAFYDADPQVGGATRGPVVAALEHQFGNGEELFDAYERDDPESTPGSVLGRAMGDAFFQFSALSAAEAWERRRGGAFVYRFDWSAGPFGACHCIDLPFLLGTDEAWANAPMLGGSTAARTPTAEAFRRAVGRFVRAGDPGWSTFSVAEPRVMRFGAHADGAALEVRQDLVERWRLVRSGRDHAARELNGGGNDDQS